jgi:hypothetical protein
MLRPHYLIYDLRFTTHDLLVFLLQALFRQLTMRDETRKEWLKNSHRLYQANTRSSCEMELNQKRDSRQHYLLADMLHTNQ